MREIKKVSTVLRHARARIEDMNDWAQGSLAVDKNGKEVTTRSPEASRWCAIGAIHTVNASKNLRARARRRLSRETGDTLGLSWSIILVNDGDRRSGTHRRILELYDRAIGSALDAESA